MQDKNGVQLSERDLVKLVKHDPEFWKSINEEDEIPWETWYTDQLAWIEGPDEFFPDCVRVRFDNPDLVTSDYEYYVFAHTEIEKVDATPDSQNKE
jgi:hypothetical protein